jgi:hypothetical protein
MYTEDMAYIDNWRLVASKLCMSATGIWFDIVTSIPWSFMDLHSYQVMLLFPWRWTQGLRTNTNQSCVSAGPTITIANDNRVVRIIKILRMMRIARIMKLVKFVT